MQANILVSELSKLFASGKLSDEDKKDIMLDIQRIYWFGEEKNEEISKKKERLA